MLHRPQEQGAIAVIVAVLLGFGVMVGAGALTIDVGKINADRRQLQNGADAVTLAVAQQCALTGTCPAPNDPTLKPLANANAADAFTKIRRVDGQTPWMTSVGSPTVAGTQAICGIGPGLNFCPSSWTSSTGNLQECPPTSLASGVNYVRVYTETENSAGNTILPYSFGAAIAGAGAGANQQACASVAWGPIAGGPAPITLSYCEWAAATGNNSASPVAGAGTYAKSPSGAAPGYDTSATDRRWPLPAPQLPLTGTAGNETIIGLQGTASTSNCPTWNTHDAPGGFGYLAATSSCNAAAAVGGWMLVDTGNTLPGSCSLLPYFNTVIYLPVFDCTVRSVSGAPALPPASTDSCTASGGSNTWYHVAGYAAFYLSGYNTSGTGASTDKNHDRTQLVTPQAPCSGNDRCISGWFLRGLVDAPLAPPLPGPPGPPFGAYSLRVVG